MGREDTTKNNNEERLQEWEVQEHESNCEWNMQDDETTQGIIESLP